MPLLHQQLPRLDFTHTYGLITVVGTIIGGIELTMYLFDKSPLAGYTMIGSALLILVAVAFYGLGQKSNMSNGVVRVFRRRDMGQILPLNRWIKEAGQDVFFLGISLQKLDIYRESLEEKARNHVHVRLIVPDPCEKWLIHAIAKSLSREETYPQELHLFFNNFLPIWLKHRDYFHIKVHKHIPAVSAAMFDNKKGNLEVYMHGCLAGNRFVIELDFAGMAKDCKENLDKLWREATDLTSPEEFRKRIDTAAEAVKELNPRSEKV